MPYRGSRDWHDLFRKCATVVIDEDEYEKAIHGYISPRVRETMAQWKPATFQGIEVIYARHAGWLMSAINTARGWKKRK